MAKTKKAPPRRRRKTTETEARRASDEWDHRRRVRRAELLEARGVRQARPQRPPQQVVPIDQAARVELALEALEDAQLQIEVLRDALADPAYTPEEIEGRARAMLRAAKGVRADGADPRMVFVERVLSFAAVVAESAWPEATVQALAQLTAGEMRELYPALRRKMREPARYDAIRRAIWASRKRTSWQAIAACWDGIEAVEADPEAWRVEWARFQRRRRPRSDP